MYALWGLHDMQVSLSGDFIVSILAYTLYNTKLNNETLSHEILIEVGLTDDQAGEVIQDANYGFANYKSTKIWVKSVLDYNNTWSLEGAFDTIFNYFQLEQLAQLVSTSGKLNKWVNDILDDMKTRYGTRNHTELGALQWANASISRDLPMKLGPLPNTAGCAFSSFCSINSTLGFIPELYWLQYLFNHTNYDYTKIAASLIQVEYNYPNTNRGTIINIENLAFMLVNLLNNNYTAVMQRFNISNPQMFGPLTTYIKSTVNLPLTLDNKTIPVDYYSFILSRFAYKALTNATAQLRFDSFWAVHTRNLFGYYLGARVSCKAILESANVSIAQAAEICIKTGWDILDPLTWTNMLPWTQASVQPSDSPLFARLLSMTGLSQAQLEGILYYVNNSIKKSLAVVQRHISEYYNCSRPVCTFDEMLLMQWSSSAFTANLTVYLRDIVRDNLTMMHWLPSNYDQAIEWLAYSPSIPMPLPLASSILNYDHLLSAHYLTLFFNSYFSGNVSKTVSSFNLPSAVYVQGLYTYLQKIVPGTGLFYTAPYHAWVDGISHPFLNFLYKTSIFEGGNPLSYPFFTIAGNNTDGPGYPKHVMNSGKSDIDKMRQYYKYYGSRFPVKYGRTMCVFCEGAYAYNTIQVWEHHNLLESGDGGKFKTYLDKDDKIKAYLDLIKRDIKLKYDDSEDYYGLNGLKFVVDEKDFLTAEFEPDNIDYDQYPNGLNGFFNLSMNFGFPFFMSLPNFYKCDKRLKKMVNFFEFKGINKTAEAYEASSDDQAYILIHDQTGSSLKLRFKMMASIAIFRDYYFSSLAQPIGEQFGLYVPYYTLFRTSELSKSFINKHFGPLMQANSLKRVFFYLGIIAGVVFLQIGFMIAVFLRRYGRKSHHRYISMAIRRSIEKRRVSQASETE